MFRMNIDYGNCNTIYEYNTEKVRQKKLDNLIWAWNLKQKNKTTWESIKGFRVEIL